MSKSSFATKLNFSALDVDELPSESEEEAIQESDNEISSSQMTSMINSNSLPESQEPLSALIQQSSKKALKAERRKIAARSSREAKEERTKNELVESRLDPGPIMDGSASSERHKSVPTSSKRSANSNGHLSDAEIDHAPSFSVIDSKGETHKGNLEILVSSSEPVIPIPKPSGIEIKAEKVLAVAGTKKASNVLMRTLTTFLMIGGFIGLMLMGHIYMIILVLICQTLVYREVTNLFTLSHKDSSDPDEDHRRDPWSKTLSWYFFAVTNYFLYGESIIYYFKHVVFAEALFLPFVTHHRFIAFTLYCIGFVGFVGSLQKNQLKRQFSLFGWVHMSLLLIVASSHFIVNNILEGLIWFWVPASLVICNDVWAYIWGVTTGRTPLIALSPKKTVEGFVGAFFSTLIFGFIWGTFFMRFNYMICPCHDLGVTAFSDIVCKPNSVFVWREWSIPIVVMIPFFGRITTIWWAPYQFHVLIMACFASLVAPFGGFFASGFKRAFDIKDFGDSIPGHGGMTDRMDCQFLMGLFSYVYYSTSIREHHVTVGSLLQLIVSGLTIEEQVRLLHDLKKYLEGRGAVPYI